MKDYNYFVGGMIFSAAERVLHAIQRLPNILEERNIELPTAYDGSQDGGYLSMYQRGENQTTGELILLGKLGSIPDIEDKEFGSKKEKYRIFAERQCQSLIQTPSAITSEGTAFGIKGGIKVNDSLILGFFGLSPLKNELLLVATARKCQSTLSENNVFGGDGRLIEITDIKGNPFLSKEIINAIIHSTGGIQ